MVPCSSASSRSSGASGSARALAGSMVKSPSRQWMGMPYSGLFPPPMAMACHCSTVPLKLISCRPVQPAKADAPMLVTVPGIVKVLNALCPWKAFLPMEVTPLLIFSVVSRGANSPLLQR